MVRSRWSRRAVIGGAAAAVVAPRFARAQTVTTLRVAYIPFEACAQALYARDQGFFRAAGLEVDLQPIQFGAAIASAVASNAVDIGYATVMTLAAAHAKGIPFTIVAAANAFAVDQAQGGALVSASPSVKNGKDLDSKTIGSPGLNTLGEYGVRAWVDAHGGDAATLKFVEIPFAEMPAALASGRIDAAYVAEPFLAQARKTSHVVGIEFDAIAPRFQVAGWFTTADWAKAHPETVTRFAAAIRDATEWAQKHPDQCVDILARELKVDRAVLAAIPRAYFTRALTPAMLQPGIDLTAKYAKFATFPAADLTFAGR